MMEALRTFMANMITPALETWRADPLSEHKAKAVVGYVNDLAERYAQALGRKGRKQIAEVRDKLAQECSDFGLVRDVADGTKHWIIDRETSRVHGAESTKIENSGGSCAIVITLKDGSKRKLMDVVEGAVAMWADKLSEPISVHRPAKSPLE